MCPRCGGDGPFAKGQTWCKSCQADYYQANSDRIKVQSKEAKRLRIEKAREWVSSYLAEHPCAWCGEGDPVVLEFDHRDRATKASTISRMTSQGCGIAALEREVAKCDVLCANCHTRKTASELGWPTRQV